MGWGGFGQQSFLIDPRESWAVSSQPWALLLVSVVNARSLGFRLWGGMGREGHQPRIRGTVDPKRRARIATVGREVFKAPSVARAECPEAGEPRTSVPTLTVFCLEGRQVLATLLRQVGTWPVVQPAAVQGNSSRGSRLCPALESAFFGKLRGTLVPGEQRL